MNKSLNALMKKLEWQLDELNLHLVEADQQSVQLHQQIQTLNKQMNQNNTNALFINPDLEINRLNFITQLLQKKEEFNIQLKNNQEIENKLKEKIQRVKTELKMLEKYLQREASQQQIQQRKTQENAMDEWIIQKRETR